jgi:hypothetical protein
VLAILPVSSGWPVDRVVDGEVLEPGAQVGVVAEPDDQGNTLRALVSNRPAGSSDAVPRGDRGFPITWSQLRGKRGAFDMPDSDTGPEPSWLPWLADSPLFIDGQQVGAFYDAVVRPAFRTVQLQISRERIEQLEKSFGGRLSATLPAWFPWLKFEVGVEADRTNTTGQQEAESITLEPVESATRQLVELSLHYLVNQPARIWFREGPQPQLPSPEAILESPRMIALVDIPADTKFIPMAAELNDGRVVTFFGQLIDKLKRDGGTLPVKYPDDASTEEGKRDRDDYWAWFSEEWNANKAVQVIEDVIGAGGRPRWIDYRVPLDSGETLHLHVAGRGEFDTGVFAYNLVKRGWKHGVRIVGSLKSKPGLNVLAIYEK